MIPLCLICFLPDPGKGPGWEAWSGSTETASVYWHWLKVNVLAVILELINATAISR